MVNHLDTDRLHEVNRRLAAELEQAGGADPETLAVHFEGAGELAKAGHYYALSADEASEALAFDRAVKLYRRCARAGPADPAAARRIRARLGDALANVGRSVEAAQAYQEAAAGADQLELIELQRRAAYQFLVSGHIDEGLSAFGAILDRVGLSLPRTPRRALLRLLLSRARLRLRGLRFRERSAADVPGEKLELIDISRSVAVGISIVDVIRGADYQTRSLLLALEAGEPLRIALALGWEAVHVACQGRPGLAADGKPGQSRRQPGGPARRPSCPGHGQPLRRRRRVSDRPLPPGARIRGPRRSDLPRSMHGRHLGAGHNTNLRPLVALVAGAAGRAGHSLPGNLPRGARARRPLHARHAQGPTSVPSSAWPRTTSRARAVTPVRRSANGPIKGFTSSISIITMAVFILTHTPVMRPPPGAGSRKPSRSCSRRSCCGLSRSTPT